MKTKLFTAMAIFVLVSCTGYSQTFLTSTDKGSSLNAMENGGVLSTVFGDEKIGYRIGYCTMNDELIAKIRNKEPTVRVKNIPTFGIEIAGNSSGDNAMISKGNELQKDAKVTLSFGWRFLNSSLKSGAETKFKACTEKELEVKKLEVALATVTHQISELRIQLASCTSDVKKEVDEKLETANKQMERIELSIAAAKKFLAAHKVAYPNSISSSSNKIEVDSLTFSVKLNSSRFSLYDSTKPFAEQFTKKSFDGQGIQVAYNAFYGGDNRHLCGISFGVQRDNNLGDLKEVEVKDVQSIAGDDGVQRSITTSQKGFKGKYEEDTYKTINTDYVIYLNKLDKTEKARPVNHFGLDIFTRTTIKDKTTTSPGIAAFITPKGAPLKVLGGISVLRDSEKKMTVNLFYGFNFN